MSETPKDARRQQPPQPNPPEPTPDETAVEETDVTAKGAESTVTASVTESAAASPEATTDRLPISAPAPDAPRRPDRIAPSMAIGVIALLLICTALMLVAN